MLSHAMLGHAMLGHAMLGHAMLGQVSDDASIIVWIAFSGALGKKPHSKFDVFPPYSTFSSPLLS